MNNIFRIIKSNLLRHGEILEFTDFYSFNKVSNLVDIPTWKIVSPIVKSIKNEK